MTQNQRTPIGPPVQVARNNGYQVFQRTYNGVARHNAKVGRIFHSPQTGQPTIAADFDIWSYDDFIKTCKAAKRHLDKLAIGTQQQQAAQVHVQVAAPITPQPPSAPQPRELPPQQAAYSQGSAVQQPSNQAIQWQEPQQPTPPPAPYPSKEYT